MSDTKVETERDSTSGPGEAAPSQIAIDGPVAAGKSAVCVQVARRLGYRFIDTGLMYRALTWLALERKIDLQDEAALGRLAASASITIESTPDDASEAGRVLVEGTDVTDRLRSSEVGRAVSLVSRVSAVREAMVANQRELARRGRVLMAGRDICTVVLPDAALKIYLDASPGERARRRYEELRGTARELSLAQVQDELARRDAIDSGRAVSPLRPAEDAVVIDTDRLSLEQVVDRILALVSCRS